MVARINTVAFSGIDVQCVDVQAQISNGLPAFTNVGYIIFSLVVMFLSIPGQSYAANVQTLPECVHWAPSWVFEEFYSPAAITRKSKLFLYRANPQICDSKEYEMGGECNPVPIKSSDALIRVGHICDEWAFINYKYRSGPENRWTHERGWIHKNDLTILPFSKEDIEQQNRFKKGELNELALAIKEDNIIEVRSLLDQKNPEYQKQVIGAATLLKKPAIVSLALSMGIDANEEHRVCSNASQAIKNIEILKLLIGAGLDVNCKESNDNSPLMYVASIRRGTKGTLNWGDIDPVEVARILVGAGANVNMLGFHNATALRNTIQSNNTDIASYLLSVGADPNNYYDDSNSLGTQAGYTILMNAIDYYPLTYDPTMIKVLLENGADVNYRKGEYDSYCDRTTQGKCTFQGQTALTRAASEGYLTVVKLLLNHGADPLEHRGDRKLPAQIARENGYEDVAVYIEQFIQKNKLKENNGRPH